MNKAEKQVATESLRNEATVIKQLRENYKEARANIEEKIRVLAERDQTQSVIWQKQYQEQLKQQLDTAISALSDKNYTQISQYLDGEYKNGFIGTMYALQKQGIPLILPIDQKRVVKMVQTGGDGIKLSKRLYTQTTKMKNAVRREVSIGLASGESFEQIAGRLSRTMGVDYSKTIRIARTEGHRVGEASKLDAALEAKKNGADIVKQWDSTLDGKTRKSHRKLNGQIRELDESFEVNGHKAKTAGHFGRPEEDINCRCTVVTRARWALEDSEYKPTKFDRKAPVKITNTGKTINQLVNISDAKSFDDFKARYEQAASAISAATVFRSVFANKNEKPTKEQRAEANNKILTCHDCVYRTEQGGTCNVFVEYKPLSVLRGGVCPAKK